MLVEINLLPKKEPKNRALLLLTIILGLVLIIGLILTYFLNQSYENKLEQLDVQSNQTKQLVAAEQKKIVDFEQSNSVVELEKTVQWAKDYPVKTVPLIQHLTALLPERGFIHFFSYTETGEIILGVQFDTSREAAYYLKNLNDSSWVKEAFLETLITSELTTPEETPEIETEQIVPRYIGEFKILINRKEIEQSSSDKQGGEG